MAVRSAVRRDLENNTTTITWEGITEADSGTPVIIPELEDKTVQTIGDFDAAGAITLQGSNDGTNWFSLTDEGTTAIVMTAATAGHRIYENPLYIRPLATAGTAVDMDVIITGVRRW